MTKIAANYPRTTFLGTNINLKHFEQLKDLLL